MNHLGSCSGVGGRRVLVTGGSGYIGGRLIAHLLGRGYSVRCLARDARKLDCKPWADHERVEILQGDAADPEATRRAMGGCFAAFYLIHSMMAAGSRYRRRDRELAETFTRAAEASGIERIIYLGGLGETGADLSEHLRSRRETEDALRSGSVPVTVFRAAMIIGAGSASFEILRYLVERLPVMVTPRWVGTECQPIAVDNAIHYLAESLTTDATRGRTLDIGGPDVLTYRELMQVMAEERGLPRRVIVPVPVLTPRLSSLWIHLVTPVSARIARPLAEGLRNRVVCRDDDAMRLMPQHLLTVREAIAASLNQLRAREVTTSWTNAGTMPGDPDWSGGTVFEDRREQVVQADTRRVFATVCRIGGDEGYHAADWLWRLRGVLDHLAGGPGLRRGRRHPEALGYGDALDFWRVTGFEPDRRLELQAEMKLPGVATLTFEVEPAGAGGSRLIQTARFRPRGLAGLAYWYAVAPLHHYVFNGMIRGIARTASQASAQTTGLTARR